MAILDGMRHIASVGLLVTATAVGGAAYKSIGPDGSVIYSDRPTPNAEEVRLPEPSTYAPPALPAGEGPPAVGEEPMSRDLYEAVRIVAPPNDGTLFAALGGVDIDVTLQPDLMEGHTLSYIVDGKELAKGLRTNRVRVTDLERGTHHLEVVVRDEGGSIVGRSARITFHLRQSSLLEPSRDKGGDTPPKDPTYKPPTDKPYNPQTPNTPTYGPPANNKPPYVPPKSTTAPYAPPGKAPSYTPAAPARPPFAPSYSPK